MTEAALATELQQLSSYYGDLEPVLKWCENNYSASPAQTREQTKHYLKEALATVSGSVLEIMGELNALLDAQEAAADEASVAANDHRLRLLLCKLEKSHTELPRVGAVAPSSVPKKHRPLTTEELEDDLADLTSPPLDASDYSELCALLGGVDSSTVAKQLAAQRDARALSLRSVATANTVSTELPEGLRPADESVHFIGAEDRSISAVQVDIDAARDREAAQHQALVNARRSPRATPHTTTRASAAIPDFAKPASSAQDRLPPPVPKRTGAQHARTSSHVSAASPAPAPAPAPAPVRGDVHPTQQSGSMSRVGERVPAAAVGTDSCTHHDDPVAGSVQQAAAGPAAAVERRLHNADPSRNEKLKAAQPSRAVPSTPVSTVMWPGLAPGEAARPDTGDADSCVDDGSVVGVTIVQTSPFARNDAERRRACGRCTESAGPSGRPDGCTIAPNARPGPGSATVGVAAAAVAANRCSDTVASSVTREEGRCVAEDGVDGGDDGAIDGCREDKNASDAVSASSIKPSAANGATPSTSPLRTGMEDGGGCAVDGGQVPVTLQGTDDDTGTC